MKKEFIEQNLNNVLTETNFEKLGEKKAGKVRDGYFSEDTVAFITTDRQSAFDQVLASIPFKGQVLNQVSAWWFERTKDIVDNHVLDVPDPNVMVGKRCAAFPFEVVVRGYLTGSTATSVWTNYKKGMREFCGHKLPDGMRKNQAFDHPIVTPSTKFEAHDRNISPEEILQENMATKQEWKIISEAALKLFAWGQETAKAHRLILVDTKYEFGKDRNGKILVIDEIHTPDSSRYWLADTYQERFASSEEPDNIDKEFLRLWFKKRCDPYHDPVLPEAPKELIIELSHRYIKLYEMITGLEFRVTDEPILQRLEKNLQKYGYL
ncbi:MAG: phosphoribosylaminoimidazolesuccinocarboxamide synthase, partial [Candidatus Bipolaricaulia bacterium]